MSMREDQIDMTILYRIFNSNYLTRQTVYEIMQSRFENPVYGTPHTDPYGTHQTDAYGILTLTLKDPSH